MSTDAFDTFRLRIHARLWKMSRAMDPLVELHVAHRPVRIVSRGTDLSFSIKGICGEGRWSQQHPRR